jgi:hypothetical protein
MADVPGKFFTAVKVRTGVSPSSPGSQVGEAVPPVNPPGSGLNSVGLTMPPAFTVANSPLTSNGTIGVTGAGTVGQYIRGDGSLADFPESSGGGSSVSYYLNGSVNQGTIGGVAYKELNKVPILGAGTQFSISGDGYIASFLTDAGDPNLLEIPGGNWNFETYFSASSSGGTPTFYVELYKYNGTTFTLIASSVTSPEFIAFGTTLTPYFSTLAVPTTTLALTDRLAIRYYVTHSGRTITMHTENNTLCQIITTFTTGITALNGLTAQVQNFAVGTSGTDFNIASATATHTFNLPTASATNRGALSSTDWTIFNGKQNALTNPVTGTGSAGQIAYFTGTTAITSESGLTWDATNNNLSIGGATANSNLTVSGSDNTDIFTVLSGVNSRLHVGTVTSPSISTYIRSQNNYALNLGTNTTNYLTILSTGNVGINTANPATAFEVNGVGLFTGTSLVGNTKNGLYIYDQAIISLAGTAARPLTIQGQTLSIYTGVTYSEKVKVFENGNVVIGTSPSDNGAKLQVSGDTNISGNIVLTNGANRILRIGSVTNYNYDLKTVGEDFQIIEAVNTPRITIKYPNGNVLINTTTDNGARLQVSGNLSTSGNVLIGTGTDSGANQPLQVVKTGNSNYLRMQTDNNASYDCGHFFTDGTNSVYAGMLRSTSGLTGAYTIYTGGNNRFHVNSAGNVLVGTTTDNGTKFQVSGNATISGSGNSLLVYSSNNSLALGVGFQGVISGYIGGISSALYGYSTNGGYVLLNSSSAWVPASDIKRKRNFEPYTKGISAILGLQPKLYNMDFQKDGEEKQVGLVAQEVKEFIPQAFEQNADFIGINYNAIIVTMVKAIQELKQEIDTLKN